jgi:hypothetical protein
VAEIRFAKTAETPNKIVGVYSLVDPGPTERGIYYFDIDKNTRIDDNLLNDFVKNTSTQILSPTDFGNHEVEDILIDAFNDNIISLTVVVLNPSGATTTQRDLYLAYIQNRRLVRCPVAFPFSYPDQLINLNTKFFNDGTALRLFGVIGSDNLVTIGSH